MLAAVIATLITNVIVDPYGIFRIVVIPGLNKTKPYPDHDLSAIKARALRRIEPDALVLGNSRAEVGFDPLSPVWISAGYRSVYNAAIPGTSLDTALALLEQTAASRRPKHILLGLDYFDFPIAPDARVKFAAPRGNDAWEDFKWVARATLTMQALMDSVTTIRRQYQTNPSQLTDLGHNPLYEYLDIARTDGYWTLFRQRAEENAKNHGRKSTNLYSDGTTTSLEFECFRRIVRWAVANDVKLTIVIYPYHLQLLLLIDAIGHWPTFEEWKERITQMVDDEAPAMNDRVTLFDYAVVGSYTTEAIPHRGDKSTATRWYWEAGHFKKELGEVILSATIGHTGPANGEFGVVLNRGNIGSHLKAQRRDLAAIRAEMPEMVQELDEITQKVKTRN